MSSEYQPRRRRRYYIAEQDEVGRPHWEESFNDQMIYGIADQELVDGVDWMTYRLLLTEDLGEFYCEIRQEEGDAVEIRFISREKLRKEALRRTH